MNPDSSHGRGPAPDRLWTDPCEEEETQQWLRRKPAVSTVLPPPEGEPEPPPHRSPWPTVLLTSLVAVLLVAIGIVGGMLVGGDDSQRAATARPLPAVPGAAPADQRSKAIRSVYATASPSVVSVRVQEGGATGSGTGFVIDAGGTIVTNAHVVSGARQVQVRLDDGKKSIDAEVLGTDASSDLAVLRIKDSGAAANLRPLVLADSDDVEVGDLAVAIGYPLGLDRTATAGIVSGLGRAIKAPNGFSIDEVIQTDAPINPGNSGGPLLDSAGRVIGVNSQIATAGGGGSVGIGFAVPSNTVREVVPRLEQGGSIKRAYLGVTTLASTVGSGAVVAEVVPGAPAQQGGVRAGDVITEIGGEDVSAPEDVSAAIEAREPGQALDIEVQRAGAERTVRVTLGTRPEKIP